MSDDFTPDQTDRLLTLLFDPSPTATALDAAGRRLCAYSERVAGYTDADVVAGANPRNLASRKK